MQLRCNDLNNLYGGELSAFAEYRQSIGAFVSQWTAIFLSVSFLGNSKSLWVISFFEYD
jgi:hypothetical protein